MKNYVAEAVALVAEIELDEILVAAWSLAVRLWSRAPSGRDSFPGLQETHGLPGRVWTVKINTAEIAEYPVWRSRVPCPRAAISTQNETVILPASIKKGKQL